MKAFRLFSTLSVALALATACASPQGTTREEKRAAVRQMRADALAKLYSEVPSARSAVESSVGYAVFSSIGTKVFVVSSGRGYGIAVDRASGKETYMRMLELGGGVGFGLKDLRQVLVFKSRPAFDRFLRDGLELGGDADVSLKSGDKGGTVAASESVQSLATRDMQIFQITEAGASVAATLSAAKYYVDDELN
jgi:lipid-binding SYLF domain-containing protein